MTTMYLFCALFLLFNIAAGLVRVMKGPTTADLVLAAQLFGTVGVAIVLLLAAGLQMPFLLDVALVLALLSPTTAIVFASVRRLR